MPDAALTNAPGDSGLRNQPSTAVPEYSKPTAEALVIPYDPSRQERLECLKLALLQFGSSTREIPTLIDKADQLFQYVAMGKKPDNDS